MINFISIITVLFLSCSSYKYSRVPDPNTVNMPFYAINDSIYKRGVQLGYERIKIDFARFKVKEDSKGRKIIKIQGDIENYITGQPLPYAYVVTGYSKNPDTIIIDIENGCQADGKGEFKCTVQIEKGKEVYFRYPSYFLEKLLLSE